MSKKSQVTLIVLLLLFGFSACTPDETQIPIATKTEALPTATPTLSPPTPTSLPSPTATQKSPFTSEGFSFLLQTDFTGYQIIDFSQMESLLFEPPGEARQYHLSANLSPSGERIAFPQSSGEIEVMTVESGQITSYIPLDDVDPIFSAEAATKTAQQRFSEAGLSIDVTSTALQSAYEQSKSILQWYQNDQTWLTAVETSQDSINLHLYNLETETLTQLESEPALVQSVHPSPTGAWILLKKGFLFDSSIWEDDRYYLLNAAEAETRPIALPENCDLPQVFWFDADHLGIIHQANLVGGFDFSLFNVPTSKMTQVFSGEFTELNNFDNKLLILSPASSDNTTLVELRSLDGEVTASKTIDALCTINAVFENQAILNCEIESMIFDQDLQMTKFDDPIFILSPAPTGDQILSVVRTGEIKLLDSNLTIKKSITLAAAPLEIRWMPDSSGFLYRTRGQIYWYDLSTESSQLLIVSDLFNDYTNVNGVWIDGN